MKSEPVDDQPEYSEVEEKPTVAAVVSPPPPVAVDPRVPSLPSTTSACAKEDDRDKNNTSTTTVAKKVEKKGLVRNVYLNKYAKLLCGKFWDVFDARCTDAKNNRAFLRMTQKEQIGKLFDELHASVSEQEFEKTMVGCSMGKDIFVTCTKTRAKLITLINKLVNE